MVQVTAFTAARSKQIEDTTVVTGTISGDDLILYQRDGTVINAGNVRGATGATGPAGPTTPDDNTVSTAKLVNLAVTGAKIADGTITLSKMGANSVDSDQYVDGSIDTAHIGTGQVTLAKMATNSVDSAQYVDGSIDTVHIGNGQVTLAKMAANSVDSDQYVNGSIDSAHLAANSVTATAIAGNAVGLSEISSTSWTGIAKGIGVNSFGGRQLPQYRKIYGDEVQLRGSVTATGMTNGDEVGYLGLGFRPPVEEAFPVAGSGGNPDMYVVVESSGSITVWGLSSSTIAHLSFSGISFSIT